MRSPYKFQLNYSGNSAKINLNCINLNLQASKKFALTRKTSVECKVCIRL